MEKEIYKLNEVEFQEIQDLYEKKLALENLIKIVDVQANRELYNQIVEDYGKAAHSFQLWWNHMNSAHNWGPGNYYVDFNSSTVLSSDA